MKSPMLQLFQRNKEEFLEWWHFNDNVMKTIFVIYALLELSMVLFLILGGLDYLGVIE